MGNLVDCRPLCDHLSVTRPYGDENMSYRGKFAIGTPAMKTNSKIIKHTHSRKSGSKPHQVFEVDNPNQPGTKIKYELCHNHLNKGHGAFCGLQPVDKAC
jgi:hypothetical protein